MKKITLLAIILPAMAFAQDAMWNDDKSSNAFNCDGFVTDAICCQDDLCNGQDENSCTSDGKKNLFCKWDKFLQKCLAFRDRENNVCCLSKPIWAGCSDLMKGVCPAHFQVPENCCSEDGKKWGNMLKGVRPGNVCCNAPCNEMKSNQCPLPDHCKKIEGRSLGDDQASSQSVGINPKYLDYSYSTGKHYGNIYATPDQLKHSNYEKYKTPEITVDDVIDMLIKAMSNDGDVVRTDESLYASPLGQHKSFRKPYKDVYVDPNLFIKHALNPFRNYNPYYYKQLYYPSYGHGKHSYGGYGGGHSYGGYGHQPSYGHSYGGHGGGYGYDKHSYGGHGGGYGYDQHSYGGHGGGHGYDKHSHGGHGGGYGYDKPSYGSHGGYDNYDQKYKSDDYDYKPKYDDGYGYKEESYDYKPKYEEDKPEPYGYKKPSYGGYDKYGKKHSYGGHGGGYGYDKPSYGSHGGYDKYKPKYDDYKPKYEKKHEHQYKPDYKPKYEQKNMDDHEHQSEDWQEPKAKSDDWNENKPDGWEE